MVLMYRPDFSLVADGVDITNVIKRNLISLTLTDNSGKTSDRLAINLSWPSDLSTPSKGAVLKLGLGFNGTLVDKGQYVVDEVTSSGPPRRIQIVANAAPMNTKKQQGALQTQKTRSFDDITIGDLVRTIATEQGLTAKVSASLSSKLLSHVDQVSESDMNLLTRLAHLFGAVSKPANGYLLFLTEGEGKTASGNTLTTFTITPPEVSNWQCRFSSRNDAKRVVATYHDVQSGQTKEVSTGTGTPEFKIVFKYPNYEEAQAAVLARAKQLNSGSDTVDVTLPAQPDLVSLVAEGYINLDGFGDVEDGNWRIKAIEFSLSDAGFQIRINGDHSTK